MVIDGSRERIDMEDIDNLIVGGYSVVGYSGHPAKVAYYGL